MFSVTRHPKGPVVVPDPNISWKEYAAFNGCPIMVGKHKHILYRAQDRPKKIGGGTFSLSTIGKARELVDGTFGQDEQFIVPTEPWDRFGCEDPRVTKLGGRYYIFYTALSAFPFVPEGIKAAVAISDDMETITERHLVTPFNAKAMSLFPEKIGGKFTLIFTSHTDGAHSKISIASFDTEEDMWNHDKWNKLYKNIDQNSSKNLLNIPKGDHDHTEIGAPPVKTPFGWLIIYSHIKNFFPGGSGPTIFGIEAVLLDLEDPSIVLGKTRTPFMVPERHYEKEGILRDIVFPSGATLHGDMLNIYYGAADTVCGMVTTQLHSLFANMEYFVKPSKLLAQKIEAYRSRHLLSRPLNKPILEARSNRDAGVEWKYDWEANGVLNPAAVHVGGRFHLFYRAMGLDNTSTIGYTSSADGIHFKESDRLDVPVYIPRADFEMKAHSKMPNGNSGCEDPRITHFESDEIGQNSKRLYMAYTAYNGEKSPMIALTSIDIDDVLDENSDPKHERWNWSQPILISKDGEDDKDGALLPTKIKGKFALIHRVNHRIVIDYSSTLNFYNRNEFENHMIIEPRPGMWDSRKVGVAMTPLRTDKGWLMLYHGIGDDGGYRVGAALLDLKDPTSVLARSPYPIFQAEMPYEKIGVVNNVVFPCGAAVHKGILYVYYGAADKVTGVATIKLSDVL